MAIYKVVGVSCVEGDYQGNHFHNLNLQVEYTNDNPKRDCYGTMTDTIKLKFSVLNELFDMGLPSQAAVESKVSGDFAFLVGEEIQCYYNRFGGVDYIKILAKDKNKAEGGNKA